MPCQNDRGRRLLLALPENLEEPHKQPQLSARGPSATPMRRLPRAGAVRGQPRVSRRAQGLAATRGQPACIPATAARVGASLCLRRRVKHARFTRSHSKAVRATSHLNRYQRSAEKNRPKRYKWRPPSQSSRHVFRPVDMCPRAQWRSHSNALPSKPALLHRGNKVSQLQPAL